MKIPTRELEFWLLGWSESHSGGCKVTFQISEDDMSYFKAATIRKGKHAGQRYAAVLVQLNDDETPDHASVVTKPTGPSPSLPASVAMSQSAGPTHKSHFPGGFCGLAVQWCSDEDFQTWLCENFEDEFDRAAKKCNPKLKSFASDVAAEVIKEVCNVASRTDLDTGVAGEVFNTKIRAPYMAYMQECKEVV